MKKFILAIAAAFMAASMASAQDMAQATELYNNGATAISMKNWTEALDCFQKALEMGKTIGADADELVANCKNAIPGVSLEIAKDLIKDAKYDEAAAKLDEVAKIAEEYENAEVAEKAKELVPQMWMQKGVDALKLKDFATAALKGQKFADAVKAAEKANSYVENATAYLIAGQSSQKLSKNADAIKYFEKYLEMKPDAKNAPAITFTVAALYQGAKNNAKALEYYKKVQDDPKFGAQAKQMIASLSK